MARHSPTLRGTITLGLTTLVVLLAIQGILAQDDSGGTRTRDSREGPARPADVDALVWLQRDADRALAVGDALAVDVRIDSRSAVGHVPFHLVFDPTVLRFEFGEEGPFLGTDGNSTVFLANTNQAGDRVVVGLSRMGQVAGVTGAGRLCTLHFTVIGAGRTDLTFARAAVRGDGKDVLASRFQPLRITVSR